MAMPRSALLLGLAGLLPFLWGVATHFSPALQGLGLRWAGPQFLGVYVILNYGVVILSFMSGVLWGFATRAEGREATLGYGLSVVPALWCFFLVGGGPVSSAIYLMAGFLGLLALDRWFWQRGLAPEWWMTLRVGLTVVVVGCLLVPAFG